MASTVHREKWTFPTDLDTSPRSPVDDDSALVPELSVVLSKILSLAHKSLPRAFHPGLTYVERVYLTRLGQWEARLKRQQRVRLLRMLQQATHIPPIYFVLGGSAATLMAVRRWVYRFAAAFLCDIVGIVYPCLKTLELLGSWSSVTQVENDAKRANKNNLGQNLDTSIEEEGNGDQLVSTPVPPRSIPITRSPSPIKSPLMQQAELGLLLRGLATTMALPNQSPPRQRSYFPSSPSPIRNMMAGSWSTMTTQATSPAGTHAPAWIEPEEMD